MIDPKRSAVDLSLPGYSLSATSKRRTDRTMTRVLHLVSSGGLYGAEQVILNLARSESTISYVGALNNVHRPNLEVIDEAKNRALRTVVFDSQGRADLHTVLEVRRFLKKYGIDILHTHGYKSDIVGFCATRFTTTRWVATNHVWHPMGGKLKLYESVDAFVLRFAARVVAVSREIRRDLIHRNVPAGKIRVVDNGIEVDRFRAKPAPALRAEFKIREGDVVITMVGRLSPEKGHAALLSAASHLQCHERVKFLIVGDGPLGESLRAETARLKLDGRVVFTGFRNDTPDIYAISDVLVNASSIEGLPMTILEAMAAGVAVVAARTGGIPDLIKDNETGLLFDAHDVEALTSHLESLVGDERNRRRLGANGAEFVRMNNSCERMCDAYRQVYQELIDDK
jgi:glycosyltransferase involved in cell wall biosynthesis